MVSNKLIICVCRGNILRSAIAEKLISQKLARFKLNNQYIVVSRSIQGTIVDTKPVRYPNITFYIPIYKQLKPVLDELMIELSQHKSTPIDLDLANKAIIILAMDEQTRCALIKLFPHLTEKIILFCDLIDTKKDITDVAYDTKETYRIKTVKEIQYVLDHGFGKLQRLINNME